MYRELVEMVYSPDVDVVTATKAFFDGAAAVVEATDSEDACPIAGVPARRAREIAVELFCLIEGAFILSRTTRDTKPISVAGRAAATIVSAALKRA